MESSERLARREERNAAKIMFFAGLGMVLVVTVLLIWPPFWHYFDKWNDY